MSSTVEKVLNLNADTTEKTKDVVVAAAAPVEPVLQTVIKDEATVVVGVGDGNNDVVVTSVVVAAATESVACKDVCKDVCGEENCVKSTNKEISKKRKTVSSPSENKTCSNVVVEGACKKMKIAVGEIGDDGGLVGAALMTPRCGF